MCTVPGGWPSCGSGPATPVVATPIVAPQAVLTPSAIAAATGAYTAPWAEHGRVHPEQAAP